MRAWAAVAGVTLMAGCAGPPPEAVQPPQPERALDARLQAGPALDDRALEPGDAAAALASFVESCPKLLGRTDDSGLTRADDWQAACDAARVWPAASARDFFIGYFETVRVNEGEGFLTGYFEPQIAGIRNEVGGQAAPGFAVPVYAVPSDLIRQPDYSGEGRAPLGRVDGAGRFVPYFARSEIVTGALDGRARVIGWAADPVDFFVLQIQGSGQLRAPDGSVMRIGYAGQNGREYVAIGRVLRERGVFQPGEATMQRIVEWLRAHPAEAEEVMSTNKSWVFFRELTGDGPLGALDVPVRPHASVAADPRFVPLGAPVLVDADHDEADGIWIAQDTGGAIKGANRLDTFWGAGERAKEIAGAMSSDATITLLVPRGTLARLLTPVR